MTIGHRIKQLRVDKGLSQIDLAKALDVQPGTIQRWERNFTPPASALVEMVELYGVDPGWLLMGREVDSPGIDQEFLSMVMTATFEGLEERRLKLPADKLTKLIFLLYDYCKLKSGKVEDDAIETVLQLVS